MQVKQIQIGNVLTKNNIFLAPIAGFTNYSFRHLLLPNGVGFSFTELVSAKGLFFGGKNSSELLCAEGDYNLTGAQIFGSDPYYMQKACESEYLEKFNVVDINMGCPVPKLYKNGEGCALLSNIRLAESVVKACVKSGKTITVKIRTGLNLGDDIASEYAKMAEDNGASLITIHGRVRQAYYSGEVDYNAIEKAKKSVKIPVIANGGIFTVEDADIMTDRTGADGVMIARGALADINLFQKILKSEERTSISKFAEQFLITFSERVGEKRACTEFRKFAGYFYKGIRDGKNARNEINSTEDISKIIEIIRKTL